nr:inositol transporter 4 [Ipomoea batatas]
MSGLKSSLEEEKCEIGDGLISEVKSAWRNRVVRRGLYAGITVQVAHNLVGIRMYYVPTILQLVGFASNTTALALSLVTSGLNAVGTIISMLLLALQGHSSYSQAVHSLDLWPSSSSYLKPKDCNSRRSKRCWKKDTNPACCFAATETPNSSQPSKVVK